MVNGNLESGSLQEACLLSATLICFYLPYSAPKAGTVKDYITQIPLKPVFLCVLVSDKVIYILERGKAEASTIWHDPAVLLTGMVVK